MNVSVLIPWRTDHGPREVVFGHVLERWRALPVEVVIGQDSGDGPFNVSAAFNDAARQATGDVFVLFGADHLPDLDAVHDAARAAHTHDSWAPVFASTGAYRQIDTGLIVNGANPELYDFAQFAPFCTGILAVSRNAWITVNGMDERFLGWGCDDVALRIALGVLVGPPVFEPIGTCRALWHPAAPRDHFEVNAARIGVYETAAAAGADAMRELVSGNAHTPFVMPAGGAA